MEVLESIGYSTSKRTVNNVLSALEDEGYIEEVDKGHKDLTDMRTLNFDRKYYTADIMQLYEKWTQLLEERIQNVGTGNWQSKSVSREGDEEVTIRMPQSSSQDSSDDGGINVEKIKLAEQTDRLLHQLDQGKYLSMFVWYAYFHLSTYTEEKTLEDLFFRDLQQPLLHELNDKQLTNVSEEEEQLLEKYRLLLVGLRLISEDYNTPIGKFISSEIYYHRMSKLSRKKLKDRDLDPKLFDGESFDEYIRTQGPDGLKE